MNRKERRAAQARFQKARRAVKKFAAQMAVTPPRAEAAALTLAPGDLDPRDYIGQTIRIRPGRPPEIRATRDTRTPA